MNLDRPFCVKTTFLLGTARSGTTWLAKIFDSHPDVLYRHEPDTVLRSSDLPKFVSQADIGLYKDAARDYLARLMEVRTLKSAGSLPIFRKSFETRLTHAARVAMIYGLRVAERLPLAIQAVRRMPLPDAIQPSRAADLCVVVKSVSSCGRARLFAEAMPGCRLVFIIRDPCGQVASMVRGSALGKFESPVPFHELLSTEQAKRYGLTAKSLRAMTAMERFTWHWAVLNEKAIDDLRDVPNASIVSYQDLAAAPFETARALFEFAGLAWNHQTETFVQDSTHYSGPDRYYQVFKNTAEAAARWRNELTQDDIRRIADIVRATSLWPFCPELHMFAAA